MGVKRLDDDSWDFMLDPKEKIGYIRLTDSPQILSRHEGCRPRVARTGVCKALVLDLRFNPGGLLDSAVEISELFLGNESIVSIRPQSRKAHQGFARDSAMNFSMVCLVNGSSASAARLSRPRCKITTAIIIGERSFGKGSVQTIHQFRPAKAEIKMTTATFWRPSGKSEQA